MNNKLLNKLLVIGGSLGVVGGATAGIVVATKKNKDANIVNNQTKFDPSRISLKDLRTIQKYDISFRDPDNEQEIIGTFSCEDYSNKNNNGKINGMDAIQWVNQYHQQYKKLPIMVVNAGGINFKNDYLVALYPKDFILFVNWFGKSIPWTPGLSTISEYRLARGIQKQGSVFVFGLFKLNDYESKEIRFTPDSFFRSKKWSFAISKFTNKELTLEEAKQAINELNKYNKRVESNKRVVPYSLEKQGSGKYILYVSNIGKEAVEASNKLFEFSEKVGDQDIQVDASGQVHIVRGDSYKIKSTKEIPTLDIMRAFAAKGKWKGIGLNFAAYVTAHEYGHMQTLTNCQDAFHNVAALGANPEGTPTLRQVFKNQNIEFINTYLSARIPSIRAFRTSKKLVKDSAGNYVYYTYKMALDDYKAALKNAQDNHLPLPHEPNPSDFANIAFEYRKVNNDGTHGNYSPMTINQIFGIDSTATSTNGDELLDPKNSEAIYYNTQFYNASGKTVLTQALQEYNTMVDVYNKDTNNPKTAPVPKMKAQILVENIKGLEAFARFLDVPVAAVMFMNANDNLLSTSSPAFQSGMDNIPGGTTMSPADNYQFIQDAIYKIKTKDGLKNWFLSSRPATGPYVSSVSLTTGKTYYVNKEAVPANEDAERYMHNFIDWFNANMRFKDVFSISGKGEQHEGHIHQDEHGNNVEGEQIFSPETLNIDPESKVAWFGSFRQYNEGTKDFFQDLYNLVLNDLSLTGDKDSKIQLSGDDGDRDGSGNDFYKLFRDVTINSFQDLVTNFEKYNHAANKVNLFAAYSQLTSINKRRALLGVYTQLGTKDLDVKVEQDLFKVLSTYVGVDSDFANTYSPQPFSIFKEQRPYKLFEMLDSSGNLLNIRLNSFESDVNLWESEYRRVLGLANDSVIPYINAYEDNEKISWIKHEITKTLKGKVAKFRLNKDYTTSVGQHKFVKIFEGAKIQSFDFNTLLDLLLVKPNSATAATASAGLFDASTINKLFATSGANDEQKEVLAKILMNNFTVGMQDIAITTKNEFINTFSQILNSAQFDSRGVAKNFLSKEWFNYINNYVDPAGTQTNHFELRKMALTKIYDAITAELAKTGRALQSPKTLGAWKEILGSSFRLVNTMSEYTDVAHIEARVLGHHSDQNAMEYVASIARPGHASLQSAAFSSYTYFFSEILTRDWVQMTYTPNFDPNHPLFSFRYTNEFTDLTEGSTGYPLYIEPSVILPEDTFLSYAIKGDVNQNVYFEKYLDAFNAIRTSNPNLYNSIRQSEFFDSANASKPSVFKDAANNNAFNLFYLMNSEVKDAWAAVKQINYGYYKDRWLRQISDRADQNWNLYDDNGQPIIDHRIQTESLKADAITGEIKHAKIDNVPEAYWWWLIGTYGAGQRALSSIWRHKDKNEVSMWGIIPTQQAKRVKYIKAEKDGVVKYIPVKTDQTNNLYYLTQQGGTQAQIEEHKHRLADDGYSTWVTDYEAIGSGENSILGAGQWHLTFVDANHNSVNNFEGHNAFSVGGHVIVENNKHIDNALTNIQDSADGEGVVMTVRELGGE